ncbi:hypothetical protein LSH36_643g00008 [Paralvinella palmiformis]|uniref:C-type lectin domain-containing protein n=1 Tax=Paralvinella palmiformis TaxID=53620 RepID=A0AAD9J3Z8_9ANNE|nr:hypothetical protein LSH36_643g00008 [Paralvinella palmiformis]
MGPIVRLPLYSFISLLVQLVQLSLGCPIMWHEYSGSCYRLYAGRNKFDQARSICQKENADLTVITDEKENDFVSDLFYSQEDIDGSSATFAYIGLTDRVEEMVFVWIDGNPLVYENWSKKEPNDASGNDDYVAIRTPAGSYPREWWDTPENKPNSFICERPIRLIAESTERQDNICVLLPSPLRGHNDSISGPGVVYYGFDVLHWIHLELLTSG